MVDPTTNTNRELQGKEAEEGKIGSLDWMNGEVLKHEKPLVQAQQPKDGEK